MELRKEVVVAVITALAVEVTVEVTAGSLRKEEQKDVARASRSSVTTKALTSLHFACCNRSDKAVAGEGASNASSTLCGRAMTCRYQERRAKTKGRTCTFTAITSDEEKRKE